jgi:hypothetical protein
MEARGRVAACLIAVVGFGRCTTPPAGTWWIGLAQRRKHWIQGMLNEDTLS